MAERLSDEGLIGRDSVRRSNDFHRTRALASINEIISGTVDLISGCRNLCSFLSHLEISDVDSMYCIIGFESETDQYPVGNVRAHFEPHFLAKLDEEYLAYSHKLQPDIIDACKRLREELVDERS